MGLTIHQKSVYLMIFNATMISRSVGKNIKEGKSVKDFKVSTFQQIEKLIDKMERNELTESDILNAIENLSNEFGISFGQAQKPINVILKYHFYLMNGNDNIKKELHCPIDSVVLKEVGRDRISLTKIHKEEYLKLQQEIKEKMERRGDTRIEFDTQWDEQHLEEEGLLYD